MHNLQVTHIVIIAFFGGTSPAINKGVNDLIPDGGYYGMAFWVGF